MIKATLWEHQKRLHNMTLPILKEYGHCYWYAGCATGKTLTAYQLIDTAGFNRSLILTTKAAITSAWVADGEKFVEGYEILPLHKGTSKDKIKLLQEYRYTDKLIVVVNYETARIITDALKMMEFSVVIADESQRLKSYNSKQSLALAELSNQIPYKLCMTGTGWDDSPLDLYGQYRFLAPVLERGNTLHSSELFGRYHRDFFPTYAEFYERDNVRIATGFKNIEQFQSLINPTLIRISTDDVRDLPPFQVITRKVAMSGKLRKVYKQMVEESIAIVDGEIVTADNPLVLGMRLHQLTGGFFTSIEGELVRVKGEKAKIEETRAIADEIGGEPFVVFTRFKEDVNLLREAFEKDGLEVKLLVGSTHEHDEFQAGSGDVLIANIAAGAEGIDLSRARYVIYYSVDHSRTMYEQSRWRVRRHEGGLPITYYHLEMEGSIDEDIYKALQGKGKMKDKIADAIERRIR